MSSPSASDTGRAPLPASLPSSAVSKDATLLTFDLGHLTAFDSAPLTAEQVTAAGGFLDAYSRDNAQLLLNRIFALPTTALPHDPGLLATLPPPITRLPRAKPLPQPKAETTWEKFARTKGIEKRKRGRMVWDEEKGAYAARYGYKRANEEGDAVILEEEETPQSQGKRAKRALSALPSVPVADPWSRLEEQRRERRQKNAKQEERNLKAAQGQRVPGTVDLAAVQEGQERKPTGKRKASFTPSHHVDVALHVAAQSTASMGAFDDLRYREPERQRTGHSRANDGVDRAKERAQQMALLSSLTANEPETSADTSRPSPVSRADKEGGSGRGRKGGGSARGAGRGRGGGGQRGRGAAGGSRGGRGGRGKR